LRISITVASKSRRPSTSSGRFDGADGLQWSLTRVRGYQYIGAEMPIYEYERADGERIEVRQAFADAPLETDPETGQNVRRLISAPGVIYRGSGFCGVSYRSGPRDKKIL
jgi:putative FmdB family regulatory protein